jgi:hypothetical protein
MLRHWGQVLLIATLRFENFGVVEIIIRDGGKSRSLLHSSSFTGRLGWKMSLDEWQVENKSLRSKQARCPPYNVALRVRGTYVPEAFQLTERVSFLVRPYSKRCLLTEQARGPPYNEVPGHYGYVVRMYPKPSS